MIPLAWSELEELALGDMHGGGEISGIKGDSREVGPGDLFVALNAGVGFVEDARARGAAGRGGSGARHLSLAPDGRTAWVSLGSSAAEIAVVALSASSGRTTSVS